MGITLKLTQNEAEALRALLVEGVLWDGSTPEIGAVHSKLVWSGDSSDWSNNFTVSGPPVFVHNRWVRGL